MTDRINGFTVVLSESRRTDDTADILNALLMIRGVAHVEPKIESSCCWLAARQEKSNLMKKMGELFNEVFK
jgi:hypothetical protein